MSLQIDGYTIQKKLGTGGMSTVYLAIQDSLGRPCALKVMSSALTRGDSFTHRFKLEGKTIAKLQHSNIVNIYDIATDDELCYIAMEYLPGGTLHDRLHEDLSLQEILGIVKQVARALGFAHEHNIIHRDIKPANIMFRRDGTAVLTDYGIAKHLSEETAALTGTGSLIGTPAYMSPEQIQVGTLTGRSDLYSLGVVFYETMIGVQPYVASNPIAVAFMHVNKPIPILPESVSFLQPLLNTLLAKEPNERFQSAAELISAIEEVEREHDTERIMLLHGRSGDAAPPSSEGNEQEPPLSQLPDTRLITVLQDDKPTRHVAPSQSRLQQPKTWIVLAALMGLLVWGALSYRSFHAEQQELRYQALLEVAERQVEQSHFLNPASDNLYITLAELNELSKDDPRAKEAITRFTDFIVIAARREQAHGTFDESLALIDKGLAFAPDDPALRDLRNQVGAQNQKRQQELRQQQQAQAIERLLALATDQIEAGKLSEPDGDNAVNSLNQVLALAPKQKQALASLNEIADRFARRAAEKLKKNDENGARDLIKKGLAISANNSTLLQQRETLDKRAAQRERSRQAKLALEQKTQELLASAKEQFQSGRLAGPGDANAAASYQQLLQLDKDNDKALAGLREVTVALKERAESSLRQGQFSDSKADVQAALDIRPRDKSLLQLQQRIGTQEAKVEREKRERKESIARLLKQAQQQIIERKLNRPANDNALHSLQQVLVLEPNHPQARKGMHQVADAYEELAREQLAAQNDEKSSAYAAAGLNVIADHNGLLAIQRELLERKREKQLHETTEREARKERVAKLLATAEQQIKEQQFTAPDTDNAYATWRAVLTLEPDNKAAKRSIEALAENILQQAETQLGRGDIGRSEEILLQGLQVWPDDRGLKSLQGRIVQKKQERKRDARVAALVAKARQQRSSGKLFFPADDNAAASLQKALVLDGTNDEARSLLESVVEQRIEAVQSELASGQFERAETLIQEASTVQPQNEQLKNMAGEVAVKRRINLLLDRAERLAAQNQFTLPKQTSALASYRHVLKIDPINAEASDAILQLPQRILASAEQALAANRWQTVASLIDQGLAIAPGDQRFLALKSEMLSTQTRLSQQRGEREQQQRIQRLLSIARNQISRQQLSSPTGDNAVATLEQILVLDAENSTAAQLMEDIADRYADLAAAAQNSGDAERAQLLVKRGLSVNPGNPKLIAQQARLLEQSERREAEAEAEAVTLAEKEQEQEQEQEQTAQLEAEQQRDAEEQAVASRETGEGAATQEIAEDTSGESPSDGVLTLLKQAALQRQRGQLLAPRGDNALASYRQALQLSPNLPSAQQGIEALKDDFRRRLAAHSEAGNIPQAAAWLEAIRAEFPTDSTLQALQKDLLRRDYRDNLRNGEDGPPLVYIPAGSFIMGDQNDAGFPNEKPAHKETVARGFMLGEMEISFAQYQQYVSASGAALPNDEGWGRGPRPVINIDWRTAKQFTRWLSTQTGQQYRLPSEIEWEYAARAGTATDYWWGNEIGSNNANCKDCGSDSGGRRSMKVGSFKPNPFGLFDTAGNVHEWVTSPYGRNYPNDGSARQGLGDNAVARGGSWFDDEKFSRASMRVMLKPGFKSFFVGLRVLRELPRPAEK